MWPKPVIVPGSSEKILPEEQRVTNQVGNTGNDAAATRDYAGLSQLLTSERLGSYQQWSGGDVAAAFALYEWNMAAAAAITHTTGMVEVIVRNAMDRELKSLAGVRGWSTWFDGAPLDRRGQDDIRKARKRARRPTNQSEQPGRVVAELTLGSCRSLAASRSLPGWWIPALFRAFPNGPPDCCDTDATIWITPLSAIVWAAGGGLMRQHDEPVSAPAGPQPGRLLAGGAGALAETKEQHMPILLSVGYAACRWRQ